MAFPLWATGNCSRKGTPGLYGGSVNSATGTCGRSDDDLARNVAHSNRSTVDEALLSEEALTDQRPTKQKLCQVETKLGLHESNTQDRAYMALSSPFNLDSPQHQDEPCNEMSFLEWYPKGDATITYPHDSEGSQAISGLHTWVIEERSPLIAQAFESSREGQQLHLDCLDPTTALPLVRYFYTGSYAPAGSQYEDVPTSLLLHCKMYRLGDLYDLLELKQQAQVHVIRQCEFGCSSPSIPNDLCKAIAYAYDYLRDHIGLIENIICYCVSCFLRHRLAKDPDFQGLAFKLRPFHQDLCKESMKREFEDDTAAAIIQMPFEPYLPHTYASREDLSRDRIEDVVYHFHGTNEEGESKRRKTEDIAEPRITTLPMRMKQPVMEESTVKDTSEASALLLSLHQKGKGKSPITPDRSSIKDRRTSFTAVSPEQLKLSEFENPVLAKMRHFANERRARTQEKEVLGPASTYVSGSRPAPPQYMDYTDINVASSSQKPSRALQDYQMQLQLLESQNKFRLLLKCQEKQRLAEQGSPSEVMSGSSKAAAQAHIKGEPVDIKSEVDVHSESPRAEHATHEKGDSDSDYGIVAAPPAVEELSSSDSDTDADTVVVDQPTPNSIPRYRTMSAASSVTLVNIGTAGTNSDDEWDLI